jgi:hypothetical protein
MVAPGSSISGEINLLPLEVLMEAMEEEADISS